MPVVDLIEKGEVFKCEPDAAVSDAVKIMSEHNVGAVLVVEDERPVGIITDRDIVIRGLYHGREPAETHVRDIMTPAVECVQGDAGVQDVLNVMRERRIRRIPVVDSNGKAVGLLSSDDILLLLSKEITDLAHAIFPSGWHPEREKLKSA